MPHDCAATVPRALNQRDRRGVSKPLKNQSFTITWRGTV